MKNQAKVIFNQLEKQLASQNYKGYDPFDSLNSRFFSNSFFMHSKFMRLAWIQFHKRSPINFRKILLVKPGYNSKGLALLIQSYIYRYKDTSDDEYLKRAYKLAGIIIENKSKHNYFCAGYNFFGRQKPLVFLEINLI